MLCVCVGDVMDVVFSVCIVRRGCLCMGGCECFVMQMLYVCVLCASYGSLLYRCGIYSLYHDVFPEC